LTDLFRPEDTANIQFTSGTTGMPKAAALNHYSLTNNARATVELLNSIKPNFDSNSTILNVLPLYHAFSYVVGSICGAYLGCANIIPAPGFNADLSIKVCFFSKKKMFGLNYILNQNFDFCRQSKIAGQPI